MKFYECDFAPCAATRRDVIRVAQRVHDDGQSVYEAFTPEAFRGWGANDIAVLIDHDATKRAGTVTAVSAWRDWWNASFVLDGPHAEQAADLIERRGKVSPGFQPLDKDPDFAVPITPAHNPTHWYTRARLNEISIASPGAIPWYQGARVTRCYQPKAPAATPVRRERAEPATAPSVDPATEHWQREAAIAAHERGNIVRFGVGEVLRVH